MMSKVLQSKSYVPGWSTDRAFFRFSFFSFSTAAIAEGART